MSTAALSSYKADAQEGARNRERIERLADLPENKVCADCPLLGPRWLSINIGVFVCLPCSGIHRNLGVHISKVRSVSMDALNDDWLDNLEKWGNKRANAVWEANVPANYPRPTATDADNQTAVLDRFIRDKYELQRFKKGGPTAGPSNGAGRPAMGAAKPASGGGGGWGDEDDWGTSPTPIGVGRSSSNNGGRPAPAVARAPSGDQPPPPPASAMPPPPKLESGAYSTGTMKGFGNPAYEAPAPRSGLGGGLFSNFITATTSVVTSAAASTLPLVRNSIESTRPLVGNLASNLSSYSTTIQEAISFDPARDLQHLRIDRDAPSGGSREAGAGGRGGVNSDGGGFEGFAGFGSEDVRGGGARPGGRQDGGDQSGWSESWGGDEDRQGPLPKSSGDPAAKRQPQPQLPQTHAQPAGFFGRLRSRSTDSDPPLSRDISDLLGKGDGDEDGERAPTEVAAAPQPASVAPVRQPSASSREAAGGETAAAAGAAPSGTSGWASSPSSVVRSSGSGNLKSRRAPAATKVQMAADDDDWGQNW